MAEPEPPTNTAHPTPDLEPAYEESGESSANGRPQRRHVSDGVGRHWLSPVGSDVKVTDNDDYHLGSDTKSMTATVIARLAEQGVLSWDQPIEQLIPNVSMNPALKGVTLAMIFSHRSGISGVQNPPGGPTTRADGNALSIEEKRPWFTFILNQPLTSTPGTK